MGRTEAKKRHTPGLQHGPARDDGVCEGGRHFGLAGSSQAAAGGGAAGLGFKRSRISVSSLTSSDGALGGSSVFPCKRLTIFTMKKTHRPMMTKSMTACKNLPYARTMAG